VWGGVVVGGCVKTNLDGGLGVETKSERSKGTREGSGRDERSG